MTPDTSFLITETQVNAILLHLSKRPYAEVFELVAILQHSLPKIETLEAEKIEAVPSTVHEIMPAAQPENQVRANGTGFIHPVELTVTPAFNLSNPFNQ